MIGQAEQSQIKPSRMTAEEDESYTKSTLGDHRDTTIEEQKVLGTLLQMNFCSMSTPLLRLQQV